MGWDIYIRGGAPGSGSEGKSGPSKLNKELGTAIYELTTGADRGEYDAYAARYNSLADDFEVFEADV